MQVNYESVIYPDHVEQVTYFEDPHRISPYMTDTYIHIISSTNFHDNDSSSSQAIS